MLKSKMSTAESFIALGGIIVGFTTCFIAGTPSVFILRMKERMEYMARHHDSLLKTMTDEQKEIFEKFDDCWSEYMSLAEAAIFEYAFKLGMQITIETRTE